MNTVANFLGISKPLGQSSNVHLLQTIIDNFTDGILILSDQGDILQANEVACQICAQFSTEQQQPNAVPQEIWFVCQTLIDIGHLYSSRPPMAESEIALEAGTTRVRAQWLKLPLNQRPCLLVTLEDRNRSIKNLVNTEVNRYCLSSREADVWLLYRANYTYKEIAAELHISINTVKKHLKNINAKQETVLDMADYRKQLSSLKSS